MIFKKAHFSNKGHFVTKIPEKEACYIKSFPTADEQSLGETRQNLKLLEKIKSKTKARLPVEIVKTIMEKIREIPREELSSKIFDFCGNNTAYLVKEHVVSKRKGKSLVKRSGARTSKILSLIVRPSDADRDIKKVLPNGYLTCKTAVEHIAALSSCRKKNMKARVGCGLYPITCRYKTYCDLLGPKAKKTYAESNSRDEVVYVHVDIKCVYQHLFTEEWCCDVVPC